MTQSTSEPNICARCHKTTVEEGAECSVPQKYGEHMGWYLNSASSLHMLCSRALMFTCFFGFGATCLQGTLTSAKRWANACSDGVSMSSAAPFSWFLAVPVRLV